MQATQDDLSPTLGARFWPKVNKNGPVPAHCAELGRCWVWTASLYKAGYGQIGMGGRGAGTKGAHVVAWMIAKGPIPDGLRVLHRCDNRPCVRPSHLFLGTQKDNIHDMLSKKRNGPTGARGSANKNAKFTEQRIVDIRELFAAGTPCRVLAEQDGVKPLTISRIVTGKTWRHVGGPLAQGGRGCRRFVPAVTTDAKADAA